jgi:hypothetical protein
MKNKTNRITLNFYYFCGTKKLNGPIVQWIECQIPVLMIWVRIPVGSQADLPKAFLQNLFHFF